MADISYYGHGGGGADDGNDTKSNSTAYSRGQNKFSSSSSSGGKQYIPNKLYSNNRNNFSGSNIDGGIVKASKAEDHSKIFVGGLSWQTTEESLRWHFEQYGQVTSVEVMRDRNTGDPRGFAFVVFADPSTLDLVMADVDKHEINHKFVDVKRAQARGIAPPSIHERQLAAAAAAEAASNGSFGPAIAPESVSSDLTMPQSTQYSVRNENGSGGERREYVSSYTPKHQQTKELTPEQLQTKVFVGGIPPSVDRDELKTIFSTYGPVVDSIVMVDQVTQRSRCFGFITFETGSDGAQKAVAAQPIAVQGRQVEVKLATPRSEQQNPHGSVPGARNTQSGGSYYNGGGSGSGVGGGNKYSNSVNGSVQTHSHTPSTSKRVVPAPGHLGLRAGKQSLTNTGEFAGLAVTYGRSGWKAGYGTKAFGTAGWAVEVRSKMQSARYRTSDYILFLILNCSIFCFFLSNKGWEDTGIPPPVTMGFSFEMLRSGKLDADEQIQATKKRRVE